MSNHGNLGKMSDIRLKLCTWGGTGHCDNKFLASVRRKCWIAQQVEAGTLPPKSVLECPFYAPGGKERG